METKTKAKKTSTKKVEVVEVVSSTEVAVVIPEIANEVVLKSGLDLSEAQRIVLNYVPLLEQVSDFTEELKTLNPDNDEDVLRAKRISTDLSKINGSADRQKKGDKALALAVGRCIDGAFNLVKGSSDLAKMDAEKIIKHAEIKEKEKMEALQREREDILLPFHENPSVFRLGEMDENTFEILKRGMEAEYNAKIESERLAKEKTEKRERRQSAIAQYSFEYSKFYGEKHIDLGEIFDAQFEEILNKCKTEFEAEEVRKKKLEEENARLQKVMEEQQKLNDLAQTRSNKLLFYDCKDFVFESLKTMSDEDFIKLVAEAKKKDEDIKAEALRLKAIEDAKRKADEEVKAKQEAERLAEITKLQEEAKKKAQEEVAKQAEIDRLKADNEKALKELEAKSTPTPITVSTGIDASQLEGLEIWINAITFPTVPPNYAFNEEAKKIGNTFYKEFVSLKKSQLQRLSDLKNK
jgi:hypothetical protein